MLAPMDITSWTLAGTLSDGFPLDIRQPFTTAMAEQAGLGRWHLGRLVSQGLLRQPLRRVYLATGGRGVIVGNR